MYLYRSIHSGYLYIHKCTSFEVQFVRNRLCALLYYFVRTNTPLLYMLYQIKKYEASLACFILTFKTLFSAVPVDKNLFFTC